MTTINIADLRVNGGTQSRASIDRAIVAEYAEAMKGGAAFPPLVVFFDGTARWLADGFHRYEAYSQAKIYDVPADIRQGTQRDAILFSVGANAVHGLRRTNDDKRRAVLTLLNDAEWVNWSNREIARACGVSEYLVRDARPICDNIADSGTRTVVRAGKSYEQQTTNIGRQIKAATPSVQPTQSRPAPEPEATAPTDPERAKIAKLTTDAMIDEIVGLRADLSDAKAKAQALTVERDDLKAKLKEATASDQGAVIGGLQKQLRAAKFARDEALAAAKRMEYRLGKAEKRVKELERLPIDMGTP